MKVLVRILALLIVLCVAGGGLAAAVPGRTLREKELWLDQVHCGGMDLLFGMRAKAAKPVRPINESKRAGQSEGIKPTANQQIAMREPNSMEQVDAGKKRAGELRIITGDEKARAIEREVFRLLNEARKSAGVSTVEWFEPIAEMAREKSRDVLEAREATHHSRKLGFCTDMYDRAGLQYSAGNEVLAGYPSADKSPSEIAKHLVDFWLTSPSHRKTFLGKEYRMAGVGTAWSAAPVPVNLKIGIASLGVAETEVVCFVFFITLAGSEK